MNFSYIYFNCLSITFRKLACFNCLPIAFSTISITLANYFKFVFKLVCFMLEKLFIHKLIPISNAYVTFS